MTDLNDRLKQQNDNLRDQLKHLEEIVENLRQQIQKLEDQPNATEDEKLKKAISDLEKMLKQQKIMNDDKDQLILKVFGFPFYPQAINWNPKSQVQIG